VSSASCPCPRHPRPIVPHLTLAPSHPRLHLTLASISLTLALSLSLSPRLASVSSVSLVPNSLHPHPSQPHTLLFQSMQQSVCLSAFDIIIDISASEPTPPVSETPAEPSTPPRPRDLDRRSLPRSRSPTPSLTSMSACSSTEMPTTPGASDDEFPALHSPSDKMAVARPRISKHPLMLIKSSSPSLLASDETSDDTFEFTLVPFSPVPGLEAEVREVQEEDEEDDALWYSRELSQVVSLSSPRAPSNSPTRPDSLLPLPRDSSSGTDRPSARSRMSKPFPAVPHPAVPNPHLDPTYPQSSTLPPRQHSTPQLTLPRLPHLFPFPLQSHPHHSISVNSQVSSSLPSPLPHLSRLPPPISPSASRLLVSPSPTPMTPTPTPDVWSTHATRTLTHRALRTLDVYAHAGHSAPGPCSSIPPRLCARPLVHVR
jgi:hypothetical protein